jgi:GNAT superfamily N-acetyltransferase
MSAAGNELAGASPSTAGGQRSAAVGATVSVRPLAGRGDVSRFVALPRRIYEGDPNWVPPLDRDVKALMNRARHPFHRHADVEFFLAWRDNQPVGRVAAVVNHAYNDFHQEKAGHFGLFECIDDDAVAGALLGAAEAWLRQRGVDRIMGPFNLSTNDEICSPGVLIDGFDTPPMVMMGHTPRWYAGLMERAGYGKSMDLLAYWIPGLEKAERLKRGLKRVQDQVGVTIRPVNMKKFDAEIEAIQSVYNKAWERNWGFVPMTDEEVRHMAKNIRPVVNPKLCAIAEVNGEPVGFALAVPDYNQALRHVGGRLFPFGLLKLLWHRRTIDAARVITLGVKRDYRQKGLDAAMVAHLCIEGPRAGYPKGECSWILETNWQMRRGIERNGGYVYKTYRVYEKPIS